LLTDAKHLWERSPHASFWGAGGADREWSLLSSKITQVFESKYVSAKEKKAARVVADRLIRE
jgi:hypothetical protein